MNSTPSPFSSSSASSTASFKVRPAQIEDLSPLATLLTECFHPPVGWMYWLNPVLKLGIYEDLRSRLQNASPHYLCLVTGVGSARNLALFSPQLAKYPDVTKSSNSVVTDPEELVGTIELTLRSSSLFGAQYPYISNLAVSPAYRRRGLARQLLCQCEPTAKKWGYREIYLHVMENNTGAIALYRNCGYHLHSTEANLGSWLWDRPHRLLLRKLL
ncbi:MAG: GNAT family N-acetyltransferase [Jaaginema sp. PMC 1079.18]|nr:GNAT family N-acetyltransferase [Jaaginema sp. PMC 1080.18]MEC4850618.1 GNAT family N-acetyltransferase [Jaaginema sp. PMC 1079.18]MEC4867821.1 GNAT family N-acetyltransferase [Jaaginema sp. PMC 1078.18]